MTVGAKQSMWKSSGLLPAEFTKLQMVDCDTKNRGTSPWGAYAKTDINNLTRDGWGLEATCIMTGVVGEWNFLCGCEYFDNESGYIKIRLHGPNGIWEHNTNYNDTSPCPVGEIQNVRIKNGTATVNSYSWTVTSSTVVNSHYFCIGGTDLVVTKNDGYKRTWPGYIGRTKVFQNGVLKGDFVPAKRKSDGICGFYDLVSGNFYPSCTAVMFKEANLGQQAPDQGIGLAYALRAWRFPAYCCSNDSWKEAA